MEDFNERKKAYLDKLRNNEELLAAIINSREKNTPEAMAMLLDPQDDMQLSLADGFATVLGDTINMMTGYDYPEEEDNYDDIFLLNIFKRVINALRSNDKEALEAIKEEVQTKTSPEVLGEMSYYLIKLFVFSAEEVLEYLFEQCHFDFDDPLEIAQFQIYFEKANQTINSFMPQYTFDKSTNLNDPELHNFFVRFATSFHEYYQRDFENKNNLGK